jgi:chromosome segregation ATPase
LTKSMKEKNAAVPPATEALAKSRPVVDDALLKTTPLRSDWTHAEKAMRKARTKYEEETEKLAAIQLRVETADEIAKLDDMNAAIEQAQQLMPTRKSELAAAERQLSEYAPTIAPLEEKLKEVSVRLATANKALAEASAEHSQRNEVVQAIAAAVAATDAANRKVADDAGLVAALKKLQERAELARVEIEDSKRHVDSATAAQQAASNAVASARATLDAANAERKRREQAVAAAKSACAATEADIVKRRSALDAAEADITDRFTRNFSVASLKPLTPEQLCWTVFRVTGVYDRHWQAQVAELDKEKPLTDEQKQDPAQLAARNIELEQRTYDKLKGNIGTFVAYYGAAAGQPQGDFFATADQALFASNGGPINSWIAPAGDNVTERIAKLSDPRKAAEELYLAVLTRLPTEEEMAEIVNYLGDRGEDKNAAAQELVWGLLNSAEFRFNH